jgi:hypothetical protein
MDAHHMLKVTAWVVVIVKIVHTDHWRGELGQLKRPVKLIDPTRSAAKHNAWARKLAREGWDRPEGRPQPKREVVFTSDHCP